MFSLLSFLRARKVNAPRITTHRTILRCERLENREVPSTVTFDFEDQWATSSGALSSLSMTKSGVSVQITRPGSWFDIVANVGTGTKPGEFGARSLDPFYAPWSNTPFIVNLSVPAMRVSLLMGDYGQDSPDNLVLEAFSGPNGTGSLLATATAQLENPADNTFDFRRLEVTALGTNSLRIIGGTPAYPNSTYIDNLTVTPAPTMFVFSFGGFRSSAKTTRLAVLQDQILHEAQPKGTVRVVAAGVIYWGHRKVSTQLSRVKTIVRTQLAQWAVKPDDIVVFIGHSYGGNLARILASDLSLDVDGDGRGADVVVTLDPIDWTRCPPSPFAVSQGRGRQTNLVRSHPPSVSAGNVLNLYQRRDPWLRGYRIANAFMNFALSSTHELIDNDKGPGPDGKKGTKDDVPLGAFNLVRTFLWYRAVASIVG